MREAYYQSVFILLFLPDIAYIASISKKDMLNLNFGFSLIFGETRKLLTLKKIIKGITRTRKNRMRNRNIAYFFRGGGGGCLTNSIVLAMHLYKYGFINI